VDPDVRNNPVNAYLLNRPDEQVLEMFAKSNGLELIPEDDYFRLAKSTTPIANSGTKPNRSKYESGPTSGDRVLNRNDVGNLDIFARTVYLIAVIQEDAEQTARHSGMD